MPEMFFLEAIVLILGFSVIAAWLFRKVRIPSVIGFLIAGLAIGPSGWALVQEDQVFSLAQLGLVLLLFTIGLELSPEPLMRSGLRIILVAWVQVFDTLSLVFIALHLFFSFGLLANLLIGLAVASSSTAITLKLLSDRGETSSTTGVIVAGMQLLQDVTIIIIMLAVSMMQASGGTDRTALQFALQLGALLLTIGVVLLARRVLPRMLDEISQHGGQELLTLFAVLMACGGAWVVTLLGWSPALGACIAGLLLADADHRHQLVAEITPFRDVFNALFFVTLGMMVDLNSALNNLPILLLLIAGTMLMKTIVAGAGVLCAGWPIRIAVQVGIIMSMLSEFSYVLALQAHTAGLIEAHVLNFIVSYAVGTMMAGALLFPIARPIADAFAGTFKGFEVDLPAMAAVGESLKHHVIIVGYGTTGANLARMLTATHVPHIVVEMNKSNVAAARRAGVPVIVGDAARMSILTHAGIEGARALVVAINDKHATGHVVAQAAARRPQLYILARSDFVNDVDRLRHLGAKLVVPQDYETSIEIGAHVLRQFGIPDNIVEAQIAAVRVSGYAMLRGKATDRAATAELISVLERTATQTFYIGKDSAACGKTIAETDLRARTGCMIIAVVRSQKPTTNPPPDFVLSASDVLVLVGAHQQIEAAKRILEGKPAPGANTSA